MLLKALGVTPELPDAPLFDLLLKALGVTPELPDVPLFDIMVSYHESFEKIGMAGINAKPLYTWTQGAKFKLMIEFVVVNNRSLLLGPEYSD